MSYFDSSLCYISAFEEKVDAVFGVNQGLSESGE